MASRSDSQPRGRRGSRNNPQTRGQRRPISVANDFTSSSVPSFEPNPYIGPSSDISGALPQGNPSQSESGIVNERLRAASGMILTKGKDVDVLQQYQSGRDSRAPSQERLRAFSDTLYSRAYASRQSSCSTSLANSSLLSLHTNQTGSQAFTHKNTELWRSYSARDQEVLGKARHLMVYEMVTNIGWPVTSSGETARKLWKDAIREVLSQASALIPGELLLPSKGIERLLMRSLTLFRAELASKAAPYAKHFFTDHDPTLEADEALFLQWKEDKCVRITDASDITCFFMHERDEEGKVIRWFGSQHLEKFHVSFWYTCDLSPMKVEAAKHVDKHVDSTLLRMYALSAVALFYAIKRESKRVTETLPHMPFTGAEFSPVYEAYHESLADAMCHAVLGSRLKARFDWLHRNGLEKMQPAQVSPPSPQKQRNKIRIPSANDIATYESCPVNSSPFDMPTNRDSTVGMSGSLASTLNMGATRTANFPPYEQSLTNSHPHRQIDSGTTSTAGASGSITGNQHSSMDWFTEFQGFGPIYYDYDL